MLHPNSIEDQKKKISSENWRDFVLEVEWRPKKKTKKTKRSPPKIEGILFPKSSGDLKRKRSSRQFGTIFGRDLGFIRADSHFFV